MGLAIFEICVSIYLSIREKIDDPKKRCGLTSICHFHAKFSVVVVQRLQILVHIQRLPHQAEIKCSQYTNIPGAAASNGRKNGSMDQWMNELFAGEQNAALSFPDVHKDKDKALHMKTDPTSK